MVPYDEQFYEAQRELSLRSARQVVPIVVDLVRPGSVVDVGCGMGTWLRVFGEHGVTDVVGVEGEHVTGLDLEIDRADVVLADLGDGDVALPRTFDLAISLEVAEHLPETSAAAFVRSLTGLAPIVVFSAAVPEQGGDHHVNEQWPDYWAAHFAAHDFVPLDVVRPAVWTNPDVAWWYAQNTLVYVHRSALARLDQRPLAGAPLSIVHPAMLLEAVARERSTPPRALLRRLVATSADAARHRGRVPEPRIEPTRHTTMERFTPTGDLAPADR